MTESTLSPAKDGHCHARAVLHEALHDAPTLAALCRALAEALECHGEQFSDEQRAGAIESEALHKALPLMTLARSSAGAFTLARAIRRTARRLESLPTRADELAAMMASDEESWLAFMNLVCGEGTP
jgi:hypothetical protein